jgi:hypothetical protein
MSLPTRTKNGYPFSDSRLYMLSVLLRFQASPSIGTPKERHAHVATHF